MSSGIGVDLLDFLAGTAQLKQALVDEGVPALNAAGEMILGDAQEKCPIDTAFLLNSGMTKPAEVHGDEVSKEVGFTADYAAAVHENTPGAKFNLDANPLATDHFLEKAIEETGPRAQEYIANRLRRRIG